MQTPCRKRVYLLFEVKLFDVIVGCVDNVLRTYPLLIAVSVTTAQTRRWLLSAWQSPSVRPSLSSQYKSAWVLAQRADSGPHLLTRDPTPTHVNAKPQIYFGGRGVFCRPFHPVPPLLPFPYFPINFPTSKWPLESSHGIYGSAISFPGGRMTFAAYQTCSSA